MIVDRTPAQKLPIVLQRRTRTTQLHCPQEFLYSRVGSLLVGGDDIPHVRDRSVGLVHTGRISVVPQMQYTVVLREEADKAHGFFDQVCWRGGGK